MCGRATPKKPGPGGLHTSPLRWAVRSVGRQDGREDLPPAAVLGFKGDFVDLELTFDPVRGIPAGMVMSRFYGLKREESQNFYRDVLTFEESCMGRLEKDWFPTVAGILRAAFDPKHAPGLARSLDEGVGTYRILLERSEGLGKAGGGGL